MRTLAAAPAASGLTASHILGTVGAGGAALAVTVFLILGIRGKGRHRLTHEQAGLLGFIAGTLYSVAGQFWTAPGQLTTSIAGSIVGPAGVFGDAGQGAVALVITAWFFLGKPRPLKGGIQGIAAATIFGTAGGIWAIFPAMVLTVLAHMGVR
jgi:hypothetical protein